MTRSVEVMSAQVNQGKLSAKLEARGSQGGFETTHAAMWVRRSAVAISDVTPAGQNSCVDFSRQIPRRGLASVCGCTK